MAAEEDLDRPWVKWPRPNHRADCALYQCTCIDLPGIRADRNTPQLDSATLEICYAETFWFEFTVQARIQDFGQRGFPIPKPEFKEMVGKACFELCG